MRLKIFFITLILVLPFWWAMNVIAGNLEGFFLNQEIAQNPEFLNAQANQEILERKLEELKIAKLAQFQEAEELEIKSKAAISVLLTPEGEEKILFEKNPDKPLAIASLSKLMTALVVFDLDETYDLSQIIEISQEAVEQEGSSKYGELIKGEELSVESLLHISLIESSNDAAYALSEPIGEEGFVELMNLYAQDLGLENTRFFNSTGLGPDEPGGPVNYSTARELVKLAKYILQEEPKIWKITANQSYEVLKPDGSLHHFIPENINKLLGEVPKIIGGKTGWSFEAGGCLLLVLEGSEKNSHLVNVILGAGDRFEEMRKLIEKTKI